MALARLPESRCALRKPAAWVRGCGAKLLEKAHIIHTCTRTMRQHREGRKAGGPSSIPGAEFGWRLFAKNESKKFNSITTSIIVDSTTVLVGRSIFAPGGSID